MADKKNFYLTTTIPYVNADPHVGFALEIVHADIIARYKRLMGHEVFFNSGTDEHGQKIFQKAKEEGQDVQAYVDHYAEQFGRLKESLNLSYDAFIRTTDPHHVAAAQELWRLCEQAGDIYKKKYKGLYCVGDEAFIKESDLVDGKCPNHPSMTPIEIEEENYFFRLSKYQDKVLEYLAQSGVILPSWRREEAIAFVSQGLEDFSISREKARMSWGVPVPGDDDQVMYVWFDALTNYISTLGWPEDAEGMFKKFWTEGEAVQVAGKDQVRFQSIMWQAMLMSANIKNTDCVVYHGFITSGGHKMSKSLGNVIEPFAIAEEYGTDALRYFLARHIHPFEDSDFTMERFKETYNANLANGLGNVVARVMQLAETYLTQPVYPPGTHFNFDYSPSLKEAMSNFDIKTAMDIIWTTLPSEETDPTVLVMNVTPSIASINLSMQIEQPFKVVKEDKVKAQEIITRQVQELALIAKTLEPFMPSTSKKIMEAIMTNKKPETLFPRKD